MGVAAAACRAGGGEGGSGQKFQLIEMQISKMPDNRVFTV